MFLLFLIINNNNLIISYIFMANSESQIPQKMISSGTEAIAHVGSDTADNVLASPQGGRIFH